MRISIHAPHARSDIAEYRIHLIFKISIHAPHARSDKSHGIFIRWKKTTISIHAPHARSDCQIPRPYKQRDSDQFSANPKKINIITAFMHIYIMFGTGSR